MRRTNNGKRGFTLVEVIVVLVVLAILAAIMIPAMTGWIDKAKEKRLIVACRTCVNAAQTLLAEQYGATGQATAPGEGDVKQLAGVPGDVSSVTLTDTAIATLTYQDDTDAVTYERMPTPHYTFKAGGAHSLGKKADMDAVFEVFSSTSNFRMDSVAADLSGTYAIKAVKKLLDEKGINLSTLGAKTWMFLPPGRGNMLVWTTCDISNLTAGTEIPVIRYCPEGQNAGQYSVWMAQVENHDTYATDDKGKRILKNAISEKTVGAELTNTLSSEDKKDLDKVLAVYNTLQLPTAP